MQTKFTTLKKLALSAVAAGTLLIPATVKGMEPLPAPLPTYDAVTSFGDSTQVAIPASLQASWRGSFTVPVHSLVKAGQWSLEDYFKIGYLKQGRYQYQTKTYKHNPKEIYTWTKQIAASVNAESKDPELTLENGYATHFVAPVIGKQLDRYNSSLKILQSLELNKSNLELAIQSTQPQRQLSELNELGITELIGRGESKFSGSPANRRHNIRVGMNKIKGVIIMPGEEFSFNKYLGPVEASEGFLPELVIKGYETIPELGGGLCQVSSTTFRAAMHAGLPITQRRNHSYAVQYYAPQGTDATIYPGVIDLRFKNDTGNSILVWPYFKGADILVFDFYGTRDGREVKLNQPVIYDRQSNGAMKATWTRTITKNGQTETDSFSSNYKPPELFQKREEFVANPDAPATPNPNQDSTETKPPAGETNENQTTDRDATNKPIDPDDQV